MSAQARYWLLKSRPHFEPSDALELHFSPAESLPDAGDGAIYRTAGRRLLVWGIGSVNGVEQRKDEVVVRASVPQNGVFMDALPADPDGAFLEMLQNDPEMLEIDMQTADRIFQNLNALRGHGASWLYGESVAPEPESNAGFAQQTSAPRPEARSGQERRQRNRRPGVLRMGDSGPQVVDLQRALSAAGYPVLEDGVFGPTTDRAVRAIQADAGEEPDGFASAETIALHERAIARRKQSAQQQTAQQQSARQQAAQQHTVTPDPPTARAGTTKLPDDGSGATPPDRAATMAAEVRRLTESHALAPDVVDSLNLAAHMGTEHGWSSLSSSLILFALMDSVGQSDLMFPIVERLRGEAGSET
ncbi:MAG TPA: peptidoglycan-binding domain-containing protein, partial [Rhodothermales bacterium]